MVQLLPDDVSSIPGTHIKAGDSKLCDYTLTNAMVHVYLNSHTSYTHIHDHTIIIEF